MSEANRVGLYYVLEDSPGTLPASPIFKQVPFVSMPGLGGSITTIESQQITPDRQVSDLITTGEEVAGDLNLELKPEVYDDILALGFFNRWDRKYEVLSSNVTSVASGVITLDPGFTNEYKTGDIVNIEGSDSGIYTVSAVGSSTITVGSTYDPVNTNNFKMYLAGYEGDTDDFALDASAKTLVITGANANKEVKVGEWVGYASQRDTDAVTQSRFFRVSKVEYASNNLTLTYDNFFTFKKFQKGVRQLTGGQLDPANSKDRIYLGSRIINGAVKRTLSLLQRFESHNPISVYRLSGLNVSTLTITFEAQNIVQMTATMLGEKVILDVGSRVLQNARKAKPLSTGADVSAIMLGGNIADAPNFVQSATITINNNLRQQTAVGYIGAAAIASGTSNVGGTLDTLFGSKDLYQQLVNNEESSYFTGFHDNNDKKFLLFDIPRVKFASGAPEVEGINTDISLSMEYAGLAHASLNYQVLCQSFPVV